LIGRPVARMGLRFAGTLMHRALPVASVSDGYILVDEPHRVKVSWRTPALQEAHEADLAHAAQRFRSLIRSAEGPLDTDLLIADFLFMLMQRAGELAFHADFEMGARRTEPQAVEDDLEKGATWNFGGGPADALETVGLQPDASRISAGRLVGWPDGTVYAVDPNGRSVRDLQRSRDRRDDRRCSSTKARNRSGRVNPRNDQIELRSSGSLLGTKRIRRDVSIITAKESKVNIASHCLTATCGSLTPYGLDITPEVMYRALGRQSPTTTKPSANGWNRSPRVVVERRAHGPSATTRCGSLLSRHWSAQRGEMMAICASPVNDGGHIRNEGDWSTSSRQEAA
jgi:hypothetical protein